VRECLPPDPWDGADPDGMDIDDCADALLANAARKMIEYFILKGNLAQPGKEEEDDDDKKVRRSCGDAEDGGCCLRVRN
jgi:hypothetical protein